MKPNLCPMETMSKGSIGHTAKYMPINLPQITGKHLIRDFEGASDLGSVTRVHEEHETRFDVTPDDPDLVFIGCDEKRYGMQHVAKEEYTIVWYEQNILRNLLTPFTTSSGHCNPSTRKLLQEVREQVNNGQSALHRGSLKRKSYLQPKALSQNSTFVRSRDSNKNVNENEDSVSKKVAKDAADQDYIQQIFELADGSDTIPSESEGSNPVRQVTAKVNEHNTEQTLEKDVEESKHNENGVFLSELISQDISKSDPLKLIRRLKPYSPILMSRRGKSTNSNEAKIHKSGEDSSEIDSSEQIGLVRPLGKKETELEVSRLLIELAAKYNAMKGHPIFAGKSYHESHLQPGRAFGNVSTVIDSSKSVMAFLSALGRRGEIFLSVSLRGMSNPPEPARQVDIELYSPVNLVKRQIIFYEEPMLAVSRLWWGLFSPKPIMYVEKRRTDGSSGKRSSLQHENEEKENRICYRECTSKFDYMRVFLLVYLHLNHPGWIEAVEEGQKYELLDEIESREQRIQANQAIATVLKEWERDRQGENMVSFILIHKALFVLADLWTSTVSLQSTCSFLILLYKDITQPPTEDMLAEARLGTNAYSLPGGAVGGGGLISSDPLQRSPLRLRRLKRLPSPVDKLLREIIEPPKAQVDRRRHRRAKSITLSESLEAYKLLSHFVKNPLLPPHPPRDQLPDAPEGHYLVMLPNMAVEHSRRKSTGPGWEFGQQARGFNRHIQTVTEGRSKFFDPSVASLKRASARINAACNDNEKRRNERLRASVSAYQKYDTQNSRLAEIESDQLASSDDSRVLQSIDNNNADLTQSVGGMLGLSMSPEEALYSTSEKSHSQPMGDLILRMQSKIASLQKPTPSSPRAGVTRMKRSESRRQNLDSKLVSLRENNFGWSSKEGVINAVSPTSPKLKQNGKSREESFVHTDMPSHPIADLVNTSLPNSDCGELTVEDLPSKENEQIGNCPSSDKCPLVSIKPEEGGRNEARDEEKTINPCLSSDSLYDKRSLGYENDIHNDISSQILNVSDSSSHEALVRVNVNNSNEEIFTDASVGTSDHLLACSKESSLEELSAMQAGILGSEDPIESEEFLPMPHLMSISEANNMEEAPQTRSPLSDKQSDESRSTTSNLILKVSVNPNNTIHSTENTEKSDLSPMFHSEPLADYKQEQPQQLQSDTINHYASSEYLLESKGDDLQGSIHAMQKGENDFEHPNEGDTLSSEGSYNDFPAFSGKALVDLAISVNEKDLISNAHASNSFSSCEEDSTIDDTALNLTSYSTSCEEVQFQSEAIYEQVQEEETMIPHPDNSIVLEPQNKPLDEFTENQDSFKADEKLDLLEEIEIVKNDLNEDDDKVIDNLDNLDNLEEVEDVKSFEAVVEVKEVVDDVEELISENSTNSTASAVYLLDLADGDGVDLVRLEELDKLENEDETRKEEVEWAEEEEISIDQVYQLSPSTAPCELDNKDKREIELNIDPTPQATSRRLSVGGLLLTREQLIDELKSWRTSIDSELIPQNKGLKPSKVNEGLDDDFGLPFPLGKMASTYLDHDMQFSFHKNVEHQSVDTAEPTYLTEEDGNTSNLSQVLKKRLESLGWSVDIVCLTQKLQKELRNSRIGTKMHREILEKINRLRNALDMPSEQAENTTYAHSLAQRQLNIIELAAMSLQQNNYSRVLKNSNTNTTETNTFEPYRQNSSGPSLQKHNPVVYRNPALRKKVSTLSTDKQELKVESSMSVPKDSKSSSVSNPGSTFLPRVGGALYVPMRASPVSFSKNYVLKDFSGLAPRQTFESSTQESIESRSLSSRKHVDRRGQCRSEAQSHKVKSHTCIDPLNFMLDESVKAFEPSPGFYYSVEHKRKVREAETSMKILAQLNRKNSPE